MSALAPRAGGPSGGALRRRARPRRVPRPGSIKMAQQHAMSGPRDEDPAQARAFASGGDGSVASGPADPRPGSKRTAPPVLGALPRALGALPRALGAAIAAALVAALAFAGGARAEHAPADPGAPVAGPDTAGGLLRAFWNGDRLEMERAGWNLGAARLADLIEGDDRPRAMAAFEAAPHAADAHALFDLLAEVAREPDRARAAAAGRAAARIARDLDRERARHLELGGGGLARAAAAWREIAADDGRDADVRVRALETAAGIASADPGQGLGFRLEAAAADADPEIRRAAFELTRRPLSEGRAALAAERAREDADDRVALAALQAVCGDLALGEAAGPRLAALGEDGLARARALVADPPPDAIRPAVIDAALCVAADDREAGRRAIASLREALEPGPLEVLNARLATGGEESE